MIENQHKNWQEVPFQVKNYQLQLTLESSEYSLFSGISLIIPLYVKYVISGILCTLFTGFILPRALYMREKHSQIGMEFMIDQADWWTPYLNNYLASSVCCMIFLKFSNKSHNMKAFIILSHSCLPFLLFTYLDGENLLLWDLVCPVEVFSLSQLLKNSFVMRHFYKIILVQYNETWWKWCKTTN